MATLTHQPSLPLESEQLLLITQQQLRTQLLQAKLVDEASAHCVIQRGEQVYLSLRGIPDEAQRREVAWAVLRLQMGAKLSPEEVPDPLRTALLVVIQKPSPMLAALLGGVLCGIIGGVMTMAFVGLIVTALNGSSELAKGLTATAVSFILSGTGIGLGATLYFWRRLSRKTTAATHPPIHLNPARKTR